MLHVALARQALTPYPLGSVVKDVVCCESGGGNRKEYFNSQAPC